MAGPCGICDSRDHWAMDCPSLSALPPLSACKSPPVPEMMCPCNEGRCPVISSHLNGRLCYICPLTSENNGCGNALCVDMVHSGGEGSTNENTQADNEDVPQRICGCEAGCCLVFTAKTIFNFGRKFYVCPRATQCKFFQWCDSPAPMCYWCHEEGHWAKYCPNNRSPGQAPCFLCHQPGHRVRDCTQKWRPGCYACGEPDHFRANCPRRRRR